MSGGGGREDCLGGERYDRSVKGIIDAPPDELWSLAGLSPGTGFAGAPHILFLGPDILFDREGKAYVLEPNSRPRGVLKTPAGEIAEAFRRLASAFLYYCEAHDLVPEKIVLLLDDQENYPEEIAGLRKALEEQGEGRYRRKTECRICSTTAFIEEVTSGGEAKLEDFRAVFRLSTDARLWDEDTCPWSAWKDRILMANPVEVDLLGGANKSAFEVALREFEKRHKVAIQRPLTLIVSRAGTGDRETVEEAVKALDYQVVIKAPDANMGKKMIILVDRAHWERMKPKALELEREYASRSLVVQRLVSPKVSSGQPTDPRINEGCIFDVRYILARNGSGVTPVSCLSRIADKPLSLLESDLTAAAEVFRTNWWGPRGEMQLYRGLAMTSQVVSFLGLGQESLVDALRQSLLSFLALEEYIGTRMALPG